MINETFETLESPKITITECLGDLTIKGQNTSEVRVRASEDDENLEVIQEGDALVIKSRTDCRITCPHDTTLRVQVARGDMKLKGVHGAVSVGEVNGSASLRDVGETNVEEVSGDLRAQQIGGALTVASVAGDARIEDIAGEAKLGQIGSDLKATGLNNGLVADAVGSDVSLGPPFPAGTTYRILAGSDLVVELPENPSLHFRVQAGSGVSSNLVDLELQEEAGTISGILGEGEASLEAQVGSTVTLRAFGSEEAYTDFDFDVDLSFLDSLDEIGAIIEARVDEAMAELDVHLQEGLRFLDSDKFRAQIEHAAEKAAHAAEHVAERARDIAEREAERARRTAEREAERARIRAERAERRWQRASGNRPTPPTPPTAPAPPEPTVDDKREERLQVLRMVEEGKLSPDEAANLLTALR